MTDWQALRDEFPFFRERVFLDAACVSLLPRRAADAVRSFTGALVDMPSRNATQHHIWMDQMRAQAVPQVAELLKAPERNVALVESTTHGLNIAARAIPWQRGDEVLMCDLEFLQVAIPFVKLDGVEPVFLHHREGIVDAAAFRDAITSRTRAVVLSSTQWSNGYRIDLQALGEATREAGVWLVVDGIQQAGAVPFELDGVDFLIAGGHKWLNAPMGTGFMYLSDRVLGELEPASWGYLSLEDPEGGWGTYFSTPEITPDRRYEFVDSAKRFETGGTGNYPGAIALAKSLELVNEVGIDRAAERVWALGERLISGLRELPVRLETPFGAENRAGIISFSLGDRERDGACVDHLLDQGICVGHRYTSGTGGVRISVHFFNDERDIDAALDATRRYLGA